jgi:hypothetical protein
MKTDLSAEKEVARVTVFWIIGALVLLFALLALAGPRVRPMLREYVRFPGRLPVRNDSHFFREQDDDPRYVGREEDGKP